MVRNLALAASAACFMLIANTQALAAEFTVGTDCGPPIQDCITAATGGDTINIPAGTYIENLDINKDLTLLGAGAGVTTIDGSRSGSVVVIFANTVTITGVTITGGEAFFGGGIENQGVLHLMHSTVIDNTSTSEGGGIFNWIGRTLHLTHSTVSGNTAVTGGGINSWGTLHLTHSTVSGNASHAPASSPSGFSGGGGIFNVGTMHLMHSTVSGNTAVKGGGIYNEGISNSIPGVLNLTHSTVSGNTVTGLIFAGGIDLVVARAAASSTWVVAL